MAGIKTSIFEKSLSPDPEVRKKCGDAPFKKKKSKIIFFFLFLFFTFQTELNYTLW